MNPPKGETKDEPLGQRIDARASWRKRENAKKAKEKADLLFPSEDWNEIENGIFLSPNRTVGKNSGFDDEFLDAQILRDLGSTVYLVPESSRQAGKKHDAIVDGMVFEFKNVGGNANTLVTQFLKSRSQAPNVFINLDTSNLSREEAISALYGARNSKTHTDRKGHVIKGYADRNRFDGGRIVLKVRGVENLIYLKVDGLKAP